MAAQLDSLQGKRVILAVGGGIAAYKAAFLASRLAQRGGVVLPVMSPAAEQFIGSATLAALCGRPVATAMFEPNRFPLGAHIELAEQADLMIVAPATADLMAKFSLGIADSLISTLYLQRECPVLIAPAMSTAMWSKAAVQRNAATLAQDGIHFVGPETGWLSCRRQGAGRMAEPESILAASEKLLAAES